MNTLQLSKKLRYGEGDQVRGIAEPYSRSIYRVIKIDKEGVHLIWESLRGMKMAGYTGNYPIKRLLIWKTPVAKNWWDDFEGAMDFRLATSEEIRQSKE